MDHSLVLNNAVGKNGIQTNASLLMCVIEAAGGAFMNILNCSYFLKSENEVLP